MEEEQYTRIEDYLDNTMDAEGRAAFEAELRADPALSELLTHVREARARLARQWAQEDADRALKNTLQQLGRQHFDKKTETISTAPRLRRWWPVLAAAACLAVLIIWLAWPAHIEEKLYADFGQFPEAAFGTRAANDPNEAILASTDAAFNAGKYAEALVLLQRQLSNQSNDRETRFFIALCQLELGQTTAAAAIFQELRATPAAYADESTWYLALTFLKEKKRAECVEVLLQISKDSQYYGRAQKLLGELGK
jgi:tetratricopeptide (TPR) repeat protein